MLTAEGPLMSELDMLQNEGVIGSNDSSAPASAGTMLRLARESQGLHIAMLAVSLKVSVKKLEALEANRFDLLPDMVFVRALASSICRNLKIDEQPVLLALPRAQAPKISVIDDDVRPRFQEAGLASHGGFRKNLKGPWGIALAMVLAGIAAIVLWPEKAATVDLLAAPPPAAPMPSSSLESLSVVPSTPQATASLAAASSAPLVAVDSNSTAAQTGVQPAASGTASLPIVASSGPLKLLAKGNSWIEVTDADGAVVFRRTLIDGENIVLTGKLPLSVVLGRADVVSVWVRDQLLDISSYTKDSVAHFEVK
jgi:cytoskeleton protein RodZ